MAKLQILQYEIHLTSAAQVATLQGNPQPGGAVGAVLMAPAQAAIDYAAPILAGTGTFEAPCITSAWFTGGGNFPLDEAEFERCTGGWFGVCFLWGTRTRYRWRGVFKYAAPSTPLTPGADAVAQRRFIDGFELPDTGEGADTVGGEYQTIARIASRHTEGYGLALRNSTLIRRHLIAQYGAPVNAARSWERIYLRIRGLPNVTKVFWRARDGAGCGVALAMTPAGQLALYLIDAVGAFNLMGSSSTFVLDRWYRLDALVEFGVGAKCSVSVQGATSLNVVMPAGVGMATVGRTHISAEVGSAEAATYAFDLDDWINAEWPASWQAEGGATGIDWLNGSKLARLTPTGFGTANVWTGDYQTLIQQPAYQSNTASLTHAVSGGRLSVTTDAHQVVDQQRGAVGVAAMVVGLHARKNSGPDGTLGYALAGGAAVLAAHVVGTTLTWTSVLYRPSGMLVPDDVTLIDLVHVKGADATVETVTALQAVVEILGVFGEEDVSPGTQVGSFAALVMPPLANLHLAPYPRSAWAIARTPPIAPVVIHAGTYVGTLAGLTLAFRAPVTWWWARRVTTLGPGTHWWSSLLGAHTGFATSIAASNLVQALLDPAYVPVVAEDAQEQQTILRITGADVESNDAGSTYVYVAVSDPGMRYSMNGAFHDHKGGLLDRVTPLAYVPWLPEAAFVFREQILAGGPNGFFYKGPGHASASLSPIDAAEIANALVFGEGEVTAKSGLHDAGMNQIAYAAWRMLDGNPVTGAVVHLGHYVGDGTAARVIALELGGNRPLFALVTPHNGASVFRDHGHTATESTLLPATANAATGITAGDFDALTVGIALNTTGIVYELFVLPGGIDAGAGGWSLPGEYVPVEPESPFATPTEGTIYPPETVPTVPPVIVPGPIPVPVECVAATTLLCNLALARIGHTQQIGDMTTELSAAAIAARLVYNDAVAQTLRDFPWPFATKYATLVLVSGPATNTDWSYSYRQPADCIFERRIVTARGGAVDPTPPPLQLSSDESGGLIFTNQAGAVLEYTARPVCAAGAGDTLFREALIWRLAGMLAPGLSRMTDIVAGAETLYAQAIARAYAVVRPGNPGARPAAVTVDVLDACQVANVAVVNQALLKIGGRTIANLTSDQSREAQAAIVLFEAELRATLRDFPWPFATVYDSALPLVRGPAAGITTVQAWAAPRAYLPGDVVVSGLVAYYCLVAHTNQAPPSAVYWTTTATAEANADWRYAYRLPAAALFARRLVTSMRRGFERHPPRFALAQDAGGGLLYTDEANPVLEYTTRPECAVSIADALFREALAWRLAAALAPSCAQTDPVKPEQEGRGPEAVGKPKDALDRVSQQRQRVAAGAWQRYQMALFTAQRAAVNERSPDTDPGDADWIRARD